MIALSVADQEPLVFPRRADVEQRLETTIASWRDWAAGRAYDGPWRDVVLRSGLALKLLVFAPSGAIAAAATTSLPEEIGGARNWDYRFSWPRDAAFTLQAFLALGCDREARAFFSWLLHASQLTHPRLQVLYRLNGRADAEERELPLRGYRGSAPVRVGNGAAHQLQLDVYGEVLSAAALYANVTGGLDRDHGRRIAEIADLVCDLWREPDAGIWEVRSQPGHFVQSKMMCAVALDRAVKLAEAGHLPKRNLERWQEERRRGSRFRRDATASPRRSKATSEPPATTRSTPRSSSPSPQATTAPMHRGSSAPSTPFVASLRAGRSCSATSARTASREKTAHLSPAPSGSWRRSRCRAASTKLLR